MKKTILLSAALILSATVWAQVPQGITHQAVIRNAANELLANQTIGMRVSILQGSAEGTAVFVETHSPTSNANGLITFVIGQGIYVSGTFAQIDWADGLYFLKTEADPTGGSNYTITGTMQFLSVPYALYAGSSSDNQWEQNGNNIFSRNTGNVGIGSEFPHSRLFVTGWASNPAIPSATSQGILRLGILQQGGIDIGKINTAPYSMWMQAGWDGIATDPISLQPLGGNIGIGTLTPEAQLHTTGSVRFEGAGTPGEGKVLTSDEHGVASWQAESDPSVPTGTTPGEMMYWNGSSWVTVPPGTSGQVLGLVNGVPTWGGAGMCMGENDVYNPATGKIWMDRNLGAGLPAAISTDAGAYGDLYQWGRGDDGHQIRTSETITTLSSSDTSGHGYFILAPDYSYDWRYPHNDNLWQGLNGVNNPCPAGYRLPTEAEWNAERLSWSTNDAEGAFGSPLKLPVGGNRYYSNGSLYYAGSSGHYWSSTVDGIFARHLFFSSSSAGTGNNFRADGLSVRCLKN